MRGRGKQEKELLAAIRAALLNFWPLVKSRRRVLDQSRDAPEPLVSLLSHAHVLLVGGGQVG